MAPAGRSQEVAPVNPCEGLVRAWVDPVYGHDPAYQLPLSLGLGLNTNLIGQINDPNAPYKSLQTAIDAVHAHLGYQWTQNATTQGVVYALPGLYGQHGAGSSLDTFPIIMRDRVNVRGLGARRCVIRGTRPYQGVPVSSKLIFWPDGGGQPGGGGAGSFDAEVLVDYGYSAVKDPSFWAGGQGTPWRGMGDSAELLDSFTLEGGDVQVLVSCPGVFPPEAMSGRITNCVFDMRDVWPVTVNSTSFVSGPWFGIMLVKGLWTNPPTFGYLEQKFLIANNTFVLAQYYGDGDVGPLSKDVAVGIIDVTNPCRGATCEPNLEQRGLGSPCLANNLFRLPPIENDRRRAMLGIEDSDVRIDDGTSNFVPSNAFQTTTSATVNLARATSNFIQLATNRGFYSRPVRPATVWNGVVNLLVNCTGAGCSVVVAPTPAVVMWDGSQAPGQVDPGFVGEYLESFISLPPQPTPLPRVLDWRLLPDSALKNRGVISNPPGVAPPLPMFVAANGVAMTDPACTDIGSYRWDGEGYGNPRIVDGHIDIGFDEIDSMIACGSWGNDSNSHNAASAILQPYAQQGRMKRYFIFDAIFQNRDCKIHGSGLIPATPPSAWSQPPETLASPIQNPLFPNLPMERKTRYIGFRDTGPTPTGSSGWTIAAANMVATPWTPLGWLQPPLAPNRFFVLANTGDDNDLLGHVPPSSTTAQPDLYFGCEAELIWIDGTTKWWSNLQSEYR